MLENCIMLTIECIQTTWLFDENTCLLKDAFRQGEVFTGAAFGQECFIATNPRGDHYVMSKKTIKTEFLIEWFSERFKIVAPYTV